MRFHLPVAMSLRSRLILVRLMARFRLERPPLFLGARPLNSKRQTVAYWQKHLLSAMSQDWCRNAL